MTSTASDAVDEAPQGLFRRWVAGELRAHLARAQMSQRALARELGVTPPWVNERLSGRYALSTDDLERIAGVLGMTPLALLGVTGGPVSPVDGPSPGRARQRTMTTCSPRNRLHVVPEIDAA